VSLRNSKKLLFISFSTIFFVLFASVCPSICQVAKAQTSAHDCCPDQADQTQDKACCDNHGDYFDNSSKDNLNQLQFNLIAVIEKFIPVIKSSNPSIHSFDENPPGIYQKNPLYIIKQSFLH
jgi:hypothetical protein